jgi:uncharacterized protein
VSFDKRVTILLDGPVGKLETVVNHPADGARAIALIAHPHPLHGGTLDNKVVQTLANAFVALGSSAYRLNFRGVGASEGVHDEGVGETEDMLAVLEYARQQQGALPLIVAGFSFGGFVAARVIQRVAAERLVLVAPAVGRFDVGGVPANTLVIHGENDDVVALDEVLDWARPQSLPITVIPGAEHYFHRRLHLIKNIVMTVCRF